MTMPLRFSQGSLCCCASRQPPLTAAASTFCDDTKPAATAPRSAVESKPAATYDPAAGPNTLASPGMFVGGAFSSDGRRLLTLSGISQLQLWEMPAGTMTRQFFKKPLTEGPTAFGWSPDGTRIATGSSVNVALFLSSSAYIAIWDAHTGALLRRCEVIGPKKEITSYRVDHLRFTPDAKRVFAVVNVGHARRTHRIWEVASGRKLVNIANALTPK